MLASMAARSSCSGGLCMRTSARPCRGASSSTISSTWVAKRSHTTCTTGRSCTSHLALASRIEKHSVATVTRPMPMRRWCASSAFSTGARQGGSRRAWYARRGAASLQRRAAAMQRRRAV
jgi:hypothetical protein